MVTVQARLRASVMAVVGAVLALGLVAPGASAWNGAYGRSTISQVSIDGGGSVADVQPGSSVSIVFDYTIKDAGCPGCDEQIQVGWSTEEQPQLCAYDGVPGAVGTSARATLQLTAPLTAGPTYLTFDSAADGACDTSRWFNGDPNNHPEQQLIGRINVATRVVTLGTTRIKQVSINGGGLDARLKPGRRFTLTFRYDHFFAGDSTNILGGALGYTFF